MQQWASLVMIFYQHIGSPKVASQHPWNRYVNIETSSNADPEPPANKFTAGSWNRSQASAPVCLPNLENAADGVSLKHTRILTPK